MRNDQSLKQPNQNLAATGIPGYDSIRDPLHPNEMRVSGRYGQTSIPVNAFLRDTRVSNLNIPVNQPAQNASYNLGRSASQPNINQATVIQPSQAHYLNHSHSQQPHYALPYYNYGIRQQCTPCQPQSYMLPVYYEEPMQVREEWERPLDARVKEQDWRFVKTEDKGGIVKYVPRGEDMVETRQGQWDQYYQPKASLPPVIPPTREKRTCCTPVLFAVLGLLALIGLILGLVLLLNAHKEVTPAQIPKIKANYVEPTRGQISQQLPAVPIPTIPITPVQPIPLTRPTFTQPLTATPSQSVTTSPAISSVSSSTVMRTDAVTMDYGYQQVSNQQNYAAVNYNNDYQVRPDTGSLTTETVYEPTNVAPVAVGNEPVATGNIAPVQSYTVTTTETITPVTNVETSSSTLTNDGNTRNVDFRVPDGYKIDEYGMVVPV